MTNQPLQATVRFDLKALGLNSVVTAAEAFEVKSP
jgi:hypothetical protein